MDMHRTAKEIGLFLTAINLVAVMAVLMFRIR